MSKPDFNTVEGRAAWFANLQFVAQKARSNIGESLGIGEPARGLYGGDEAPRLAAELEPYLFGDRLNLLEIITRIIDGGVYSDSNVCNVLALADKSPAFGLVYALLVGEELPGVIDFMRSTTLHII